MRRIGCAGDVACPFAPVRRRSRGATVGAPILGALSVRLAMSLMRTMKRSALRSECTSMEYALAGHLSQPQSLGEGFEDSGHS